MLQSLLSFDTSLLLSARAMISPEYARYVQIAWELIVVWGALLLIGIWLKWVQKKDTHYKIASLEIASTIALTFIVYSVINLGLPQDWRISPQLVADGIKPLIPHPLDNSFPSGHALFSAALFVGLFCFLRNRWLLAITAILGLITVSARVMGGVHYPLDIIGGLVFGGVGAWIASTIIEKTSFLRRYIFPIFLRVASWIRL